MQKIKAYKCPECKKVFQTLGGWGRHMDTIHPGVITEGWSYARYYYYLLTGKTHGTCIMCKNPTEWNEASQKYNRFCEDPRCKKDYRNIFWQRQIDAGKDKIMYDPNHQRYMLSQKKNTKMYEFADGGKIEHVSSYEREFLKMMDTLLHWPSSDIMGPSPHTYFYEYTNLNEYQAFRLLPDKPTGWKPGDAIALKLPSSDRIETLLLTHGGDTTTPRIPFYQEVDEAISAYNMNNSLKTKMYVVVPVHRKEEFYLPTIEESPIVSSFPELWAKNDIEVKIIGEIGHWKGTGVRKVKTLGMRYDIPTWQYDWTEVYPEKRFYIPDYYIPSINTEIEIKQTTNKHPKILAIDKVKEAQKDKMMKKQTFTNYIKINDNDFTPFFDYLYSIKDDLPKEAKAATPATEQSEYTIVSGDKSSLPGLRRVLFTKENVDKYKETTRGWKYGLIHARTGKNIEGYIFLDISDEVAAYVGVDTEKDMIICLEVSPAYRGKGYGTRLLQMAIGDFGATNLTVQKTNSDAIALYTKNGFTITSVNPSMFGMTLKKKEPDPIIPTSLPDIKAHCYRIEKWESGKGSNVLFVTGLSASGKSTLSLFVMDQMEKAGYKCDMFSLDNIGFYKSLRGRKRSERNDIENALCDFLKSHNEDTSKMSAIEWQKFYSDALDFLIGYIKKNPETYFILEGIQLAHPQSDKIMSMIEKSPVIIIEATIQDCMKRRKDRDSGFSINDKSATYMEMIHWYQDRLKMLTKFDLEISKGSEKIPFSVNVLPISGANESMIAMEGFFDIFKKGANKEDTRTQVLSSWYDKIFTRNAKNLVDKNPKPMKYFTFKKVLIDDKDKMIKIQNIDIHLLLQRMMNTYGEKRLDLIFDRTYDLKSIKKFKAKKISRGQMKITSIYTPLFFALELSIIFEELGHDYNERVYLTLSREIYEKTWLKQSDNVNLDAYTIDESRLSNLNPQYTLKEHQKEFITLYPKLKARLNLDGYILAFDQGLGKTLTAIALAECLNKDQIVIVCPNSLKEVWKSEIGKYLARYSKNSTLYKLDVVIAQSGGRLTKVPPKFVITNQESIGNAYPYLTHENGANTMLIIDEVHNFRNKASKRTQELIALKKEMNASDVLPMSGTPIKAAPSELTPAIMLIDPLFTDHAADIYNACFKLDETTAMSIVQQRFGKIIYRKTKEILELPDRTIDTLKWRIKSPEKFLMMNVKKEVTIVFEREFKKKLEDAAPLQKELINYVETYSSATVKQNSFYITFLVGISEGEGMKMHEIDQDFVDSFLTTYLIPNLTSEYDIDRIRFLEINFIRMKQSAMGIAIGEIYPKYRTEMFTRMIDENIDELVERIMNNPSKTVIFSQIKPVVEHLQQILTQYGIGVIKIVGGGSASNRQELIETFKNDDNYRVMVATSQTVGTGVTLIEATQMFFFGPPWRSTDFDQCCDRIYRIGQTQDVQIFNVILDTPQFNLSDRMQKIMDWSNKMFSASMDLSEEITAESANESFIKFEMEFYNTLSQGGNYIV